MPLLHAVEQLRRIVTIVELRTAMHLARRLMTKRNRLIDTIAAAAAKFAAKQRPDKEAAHTLEAALFTVGDTIARYAATKRQTLWVDKKSVELPSGVLSWRKAARGIIIIDAEKSIAELKSLKLDAPFVRTIEEPNVQNMLQHIPELEALIKAGRITQIKITPENEEVFTITPAGSKRYLRKNPNGAWTLETPRQRDRKLPS
jgi:phage host-nuclease inhibitor protein Gam